jgi:hypothetical protein
MVTPNFLYRADEKGVDKAIVIYDLVYIASSYDLIQKEAFMITLGTSEKKSERFTVPILCQLQYFLILGFLADN